MINPKVFQISNVTDWQPVKAYLLKVAPRLAIPSADVASKTHQDAVARVEKLSPEQKREVEAATVVILYHQQMLLSLVMTVEPDQKPHISVTRLFNGQLILVDDPVALECAKALLGSDYEERIEGGFANVRNFYSLHKLVS